ncbi:hypothetical protein RF11_15464 [Thelohanellus kitauei]|uniref:Uncharacterized protein n=1 Tax=Thelohanellus kitauei TaxID=669202 RepID=A0A0C2M4N7_THEKT|nr:hypothetical protein RF11_15464 [Thelohanellus kitauei]
MIKSRTNVLDSYGQTVIKNVTSSNSQFYIFFKKAGDLKAECEIKCYFFDENMVIRVKKCHISVDSNTFHAIHKFSIGHEFVLMKEVKYEFEDFTIKFEESKINQGLLTFRFDKLYIEFERQENTCKLQKK